MKKSIIQPSPDAFNFDLSPHILVVDDEEAVRQICQKCLEREGYAIELAQNGLAALEKLRQFEDIQIVMTDMMMPAMGGVDLLETIKRDYPHIEVIMMTGNATIQSAIDAMKKGAQEFILKPAKPELILNVIRKCIDKITASKTIAELSEAYKKTKQLEAMKDKFLAITSHELRTPVNHLKSFVSVLDESAGFEICPKERREYMRVISKSIDDLQEIVTNMFDVLRAENAAIPLRIDSLDIHELLKEIFDEYRIASQDDRRNQTITMDLSATNTKIEADRLKVKGLISHLIQNAKKFTPDFGKIALQSRDDGEFIVVAIQDNGVGIPEDELGNVFNEFYEVGPVQKHGTSKTNFGGGGLGLGLSLSRAIATAHGGGIRVKSEVGKGSEFMVYLPQKQTNETSAI